MKYQKINFNIKLILIVILLIFVNTIFSQIVINEYSASNLHLFKDNYGKTEDWIELYNTSDKEIKIGSWYLSDKKKKPGKWKIPKGTVIKPKGFLLFWCSGRDEYKDNNYHTNFKLSQTPGKDKVILSNSSKKIIEKYDLDITLTEHSRCRSIDGSGEWQICSNPSPGSSNNNSNHFGSYTRTPTMDKKPGYYSDKVIVTIINNEPNSQLRYTINGNNVTNDSPIYTKPLEISKTTVVKARAFSLQDDILTGKMDFNTYFIDEEFSLPVFSVASDDVEDLANGDKSLRPIGSLEYFNLNKEREATSFGSLNKHGQDSWILPHRSIDWISRDEMGYSKSVKAKLFTYSERDSYQKFMFRNSGDDNYPANDDDDHIGSTHIRDEFVQTLALEGGMHLDTRAVRRVILFLNGKYWGLYGMREKPVDNDFTKEYYDQDKYHIHYLTTWETTKAKYGGEEAIKDWFEIRDFILNNDMGESNNFNLVKKEIDIISLIDYFIGNMVPVAKDWLNYNTAWWRGTDPEGSHKKWGYLLWDMDATFDYYINYTNIPNDQYNAKPCDIDSISIAMDDFFGTNQNDTVVPSECNTILNGSCPYPSTDSIFIKVIEKESYCCDTDWDSYCQNIYDIFKNPDKDTCSTILDGSCPYSMDDTIFQITTIYQPSCCSEEWTSNCQEIYDYLNPDNGELRGNVGKHEKLFIKLRDENQEFRELYYARQADLNNTVFSCENMNNTLNRMLAVIEPEMPKQIKRWGGNLNEWKSNVVKLKKFVNDRCNYLDESMTTCFDLVGPFELTIISEPLNVCEIKLNTIDILTFPWTGNYYGGMKNKFSVKIKEEFNAKYKFSHWESKNGISLFPNVNSKDIGIDLNKKDTLIAVYSPLSNTINSKIPFNNFEIYPNPTESTFNISFSVKSNSNVSIDLYTTLGEKVASVINDKKYIGNEINYINFDCVKKGVGKGVYLVKMKINNSIFTKKVIIID